MARYIQIVRTDRYPLPRRRPRGRDPGYTLRVICSRYFGNTPIDSVDWWAPPTAMLWTAEWKSDAFAS